MDNLTVTPQQCASSVIYGIDLGDRFSDLCGLDGATGEILEEGRFVTTPKGLARRFSKLNPVIVAIEAGTHSRWVSKQLEDYGHKALVAHPSKVRLICDNDTKNDKLDAMRLAMLARADPRLLHPIKHRGQEAQADLAIVKARDALVQVRTKLVNHLRGTVKGFGTRLPSCRAAAFHRKVAEQVPDELRPALEPLLDQLAALEPAIKHYDKLIKQRAAEVYPEAERLQQITGVGPITSLAFVLTLEDPYRFPNGGAVGSYLGLRPKQKASGGPEGSNPKLRITKAGNSYLRRLLVGSAHYVLGRFGPDSDIKRWGNRIAKRGGKKKAVVAVARKLGVLLHHLWLTGEDYDPFRQSASRKKGAA
jgi:transposase